MPGPARSWGLLIGFLAASMAPLPARSFSPPAFTQAHLNRLPKARTLSTPLCMSTEPEGFGRRALIAGTLGPLASVVTAYSVVPLVLGPEMRKNDIYKANFASRMGEMDDYEKGILSMKKSLFSIIDKGEDVIDLGAGLGPNIPLLPKGVGSYLAVEPNKFMHDRITERAQEQFGTAPAILEDLREVATGSADVILCTLVLCSVPDQAQVLDEVLRVLRPGGRFLFVEHVLASGEAYPAPWNMDGFDWGRFWYRIAQHAIAPLQAGLADGCTPNRDTIQAISAKFSDYFYKQFDVPALWGSPDVLSYFPIGPHVAGVGIKRPFTSQGQLARIQFGFCASGENVLEIPSDEVEQGKWAIAKQAELGQRSAEGRADLRCQ